MTRIEALSPWRTEMLPDPVETSTCGTPVTFSVRSKRPSSAAKAIVVKTKKTTNAERRRCLFRMCHAPVLRPSPRNDKTKTPRVATGRESLLQHYLLTFLQARRDFGLGAIGNSNLHRHLILAILAFRVRDLDRCFLVAVVD